MKFSIEALIGDRYDATDSLDKDQIHNWLLNMQKNDILKVETADEYWEDISEQLFELIKTGIDRKNYDFKMDKGHLWLNLEIPIE
jgi:hypothetical protein|tara:strand:+ start:30 stop:284 length:255 start_codon:yes stop_codon:yes gene_type:complete